MTRADSGTEREEKTMPFYQCYTPDDVLNEDSTQQIVDEITRIHCAVTGAPRSYVNVQFLELPKGRHFSGGRQTNHSIVFGHIRAGRTYEQRTSMLRDLSEAWTRVSGQSEVDVVIALVEVPSEDIMEAGLIAPLPGQEQQWFAEHHDKLVELGWADQ